MIKRFYIIIRLFFLIPSISCAMNTHNDSSSESSFLSVAFCKNKIFLAGTSGLEAYNTITKQRTSLSDKPTHHIALHQNLDKLAVSNQRELAIYNTHNEKKIEILPPLVHWQSTPITFSSTDDILYSYRKGIFTAHNPQPLTLKKCHVSRTHDTAHCIQIMCHPIKKEFLYPSARREIAIITPKNSFNNIQTISSPANDYISHAIYNPDATIIAINDTHEKCCIFDLTNNVCEILYYPSHCTAEHYTSMVFHPKRKIIALLTDKGSVHYWNYITKKIIAVTYNYLRPNNDTEQTIHISRTKQLDFSPDGKYLALALSDKFRILTVPYDNLVMIHYVIKKNIHPDIAQYIISKFPDILELEYLNFMELLQT